MASSYLQYATWGLLVSDWDAVLTIMYRCTRFHITLKVKDLDGVKSTSHHVSLEQQFGKR
jgi:hypothetical protein